MDSLCEAESHYKESVKDCGDTGSARLKPGTRPQHDLGDSVSWGVREAADRRTAPVLSAPFPHGDWAASYSTPRLSKTSECQGTWASRMEGAGGRARQQVALGVPGQN